jgi:hypothetical protein
LLILTALLLGALGTFSYSYAPLHRAKDWQIDYLEGRLEVRNAHVLELEVELRESKASMVGQPSGDEVDALRAQLNEANDLAASHQKQMNELERKLKSATRSRDKWKSRHVAAMSELEGAKAEPAPSDVADSRPEPIAEPTAPVAAAQDSASEVPASPAPVSPDEEPSGGDLLED